MNSSNPRDLCTRLVKKHSGELYGYAYRWSGKPDLAEDLVAETFSEAWKGIHQLQDPEKARAWLFRILRRRCARNVEAKKSQLPTTPIEEHQPMDPRDDHRGYQLHDSLQHALLKLDEKHRLPFLSVTLEGLSCREAAEQLGLPLGTLLSRIHRAKKELQAHLKDFSTPQSKSNIQPFPGSVS